MEPEEAFGIVLKRMRVSLGLSQERLAFAADLQRNYVSLLERGLNSPSLKTLFKLAPVLGVPVSELLRMVEREAESEA